MVAQYIQRVVSESPLSSARENQIIDTLNELKAARGGICQCSYEVGYIRETWSYDLKSGNMGAAAALGVVVVTYLLGRVAQKLWRET